MSRRIKTSLLSAVLIFTLAACGNVTTQTNLALTVTAQALLIQQGGQAPASANQNPANPSSTSTPVSPSGAAATAVPLPATAVPSSGSVAGTLPPAAPSDLKVDAICTPVADNPGTTGYTGTISWKDNSTDEEGFGGILGDVPNPFWNLGPNTTSINFGPYYFEDAKWPNGSIIVQVHAYNKVGSSANISAAIVCPTEGPGAPPSAPGAPVAPSGLQADFTCVAVNSTTTRVSGTISWMDNSNNETGFTVGVPYKSAPSDANTNGVSEYNLWPNSTSLNFSNDVSITEVPTNGSISFYVIALGATENAPAIWNTVACPSGS
jgi:hypothetical protein